MKLRKKPILGRQGKGGVFKKQPAFHYSSYRLQSERLYERGATIKEAVPLFKRIKKLVLSLPYIVGAGALLLAVIYVLSLSTDPQVTINGKKDLLRDKNLYYKAAQEALLSSWGNRSKITIDHDKVASDVKSTFPELSEVQVSTPLFLHRPRVEVTLAQPSAILASNGKNFLIDDRGIALFDIDESFLELDTASLPKINDLTNFDVKTADHALTSNQINYIYEVVKQAEAKGLKPEYLNLLARGGELHVKFQHRSYYVKFNFYEDARKSVGTFLAVKEHLEREKQKPQEYIDVRVPERAYLR